MVRRSPSGWIDAMRKGQPYPIKALVCCNNPLSNWPSQQAAREAFLALDLLVHVELFENETSAYADYVLPCATGIEKGDIGRSTGRPSRRLDRQDDRSRRARRKPTTGSGSSSASASATTTC
jgi:anaerobic selenocysteine-containing dehydrogenase